MATTYTAIASGNWSSSATWTGGVVPPVPLNTSSDTVNIGNYSVTYDGNGGVLGWTQGNLNLNPTTTGTNTFTATTVNLSGGTITVGSKAAIAWAAFNISGTGKIVDQRTGNNMASFGTITYTGSFSWDLQGGGIIDFSGTAQKWINPSGSANLVQSGAGTIANLSGNIQGFTAVGTATWQFIGNTTFLTCPWGTAPGGWTFMQPNISIIIPAGATFAHCGVAFSPHANGGNSLINYGTVTIDGMFSAATSKFKLVNYGTMNLSSMSGNVTLNCPVDNYKALSLYVGPVITFGANTRIRQMRREATFTEQHGYVIGDSSNIAGLPRAMRVGA
jgi:hypothetical protein